MAINGRDLEVLGECLVAFVDGPFIPDWEFHTLTGFERSDYRHLLADWPDADFANRDVRAMVMNCLVNLLGYPHGEDRRLVELVSVSKIDLAAILERWRQVYG